MDLEKRGYEKQSREVYHGRETEDSANSRLLNPEKAIELSDFRKNRE